MSTESTDPSTRIDRERAFHDDRFNDDSARAAAGRFYRLAGAANDSYRSALAEAQPGIRALEYGAGTGGDGFSLARRGIRVTGIDISPVGVDEANVSASLEGLSRSECHYEVMNAEQLEFPDHSFDLVFGSAILHHLDLDAAFSEIRRVLVPGGRAVFFEPMGHNPAINLYRRLTPAMRTVDEHPLLVSDLDAAGRFFATVDPEYHVLASFAAVPFQKSDRAPWMIDKLNDVDRWLFRRVPAIARFGWIVILRLGDPRPTA